MGRAVFHRLFQTLTKAPVPKQRRLKRRRVFEDSEDEVEVPKAVPVMELRQEGPPGEEAFRQVRVTSPELQNSRVLGLDAAVQQGTADQLLKQVEEEMRKSTFAAWDETFARPSRASADQAKAETMPEEKEELPELQPACNPSKVRLHQALSPRSSCLTRLRRLLRRGSTRMNEMEMSADECARKKRESGGAAWVFERTGLLGSGPWWRGSLLLVTIMLPYVCRRRIGLEKTDAVWDLHLGACWAGGGVNSTKPSQLAAPVV
ncbi:unnamed protein product [Durusdinium trenchii]|uniref:Uncharacterized protein n=1 Tax=Durusdinium trenchii TaxID=1381693 RepID=A0ABP0NZZ6_9DINO